MTLDIKKRWDEIDALKKQGLSYGQIALRYGISRQRAYQIANRKRPSGKAGRPRKLLAYVIQTHGNECASEGEGTK